MATFSPDEYREFWSRRRADLNALEREARTTPMTSGDVTELLSRLVQKRDELDRLVLSSFGVSIQTSPPRLMPWVREPEDDHEHEIFSKAYAGYTGYCLTIGKIVNDVLPLPFWERGAAATRVVLSVARDYFPHSMALIMKLTPAKGLQDAASMSLAAWVATETSLSTNRRLQHRLDYEASIGAGTRRSVLYDLLLGQVWIAAENIHEKTWSSAGFVAATVDPLARAGQVPIRGHSTKYAQVEVFPDDPEAIASPTQTPEDLFIIRELFSEAVQHQQAQAEVEARRLRECAQRYRDAGLTDQQVAIMVLREQGHKGPEIALRLGTTSLNVRQQIHKVGKLLARNERKAS